MTHLVRHLLAEYYGCAAGADLDDPEAVRRWMLEAAARSRTQVLEVVVHKFSPQGVTGLLVLAESHLALHTWPEHDLATAEIFACGDEADVWAGHAFLVDALRPRDVEVREIERGDLARIVPDAPPGAW